MNLPAKIRNAIRPLDEWMMEWWGSERKDANSTILWLVTNPLYSKVETSTSFLDESACSIAFRGMKLNKWSMALLCLPSFHIRFRPTTTDRRLYSPLMRNGQGWFFTVLGTEALFFRGTHKMKCWMSLNFWIGGWWWRIDGGWTETAAASFSSADLALTAAAATYTQTHRHTPGMAHQH